MRGTAHEEVPLLSLTNESKRSSLQESTGSSRSRSVLESHCRTTLGQRKNGATGKMLELEHRPKCSNQGRMVPIQKKSLVNRRILNKLRSGGQDRAFGSALKVSPLLQTKNHNEQRQQSLNVK